MRFTFNTTSAQLVPLAQETFTFDNEFDCILAHGQWYVFNKKHFEVLLCLEDGFRAAANGVIESLERQNCVDGINHLHTVVDAAGIRILRRLAAIAREERFMTMDGQRIARIETMTLEYGLAVRVVDKKLVITDPQQADEFTLLLLDAYLQSPQTDFRYLVLQKSHMPD